MRVKNSMSLATTKLFSMLTKTLIVQSALGIVLILIPFLFGGYIFFTHNSRGSFYGQFIFFPISLHCFFEASTLLYMVKPYRLYVHYLYKKLVGKYLLRENQVVDLAQNTTTVYPANTITVFPVNTIMVLSRSRSPSANGQCVVR
jgi:hypothetical protein